MRILQLCHKPPVPAKDGGCIAMNNVTQGLLNAGHEVKLLTIFTHKHPLELDRLPENYIHDTDIEGIYVDTRVNLVDAFSSMITRDSYNINRFFSVDFDIRLKRVLQKERFDIVHLESLFMTPYIGTIRRYARRAKIILRSHNLEYIIWDRIATGTRNPAKRAYLKYLSKKLKSYELGMLNEVDGIAAISAGDAEKYASLGCPRPVITLPFGIDLDNYEVSLTQTDHTPLRLFHVGAMDWRPNLEGILWFIERIWPNIRSATEDAELHLAGRGLDPEMFPEGIAGLHIHGEVECAKSFMDDHHIMIVPLLSAGGIRVKIIEGMAKGKAIITTQVGAEGIDYEDGRHLRIARSENEWSTIVEEWNRNRSRLEATGMAARALAEKHFDNRLIIDKLLAFYRDTLKL